MHQDNAYQAKALRRPAGQSWHTASQKPGGYETDWHWSHDGKLARMPEARAFKSWRCYIILLRANHSSSIKAGVIGLTHYINRIVGWRGINKTLSLP
jgi:hypothetical protein